jgi:hypothetical protein
MRQGPHHGAQKSTTTGSDAAEISASNDAASGTSTGSPGAGSAAWQLAHLVDAPNAEDLTRFVLPHDTHGINTPRGSSFNLDMHAAGPLATQSPCPSDRPTASVVSGFSRTTSITVI